MPVILLELETTDFTDYTVKKMYIYNNAEILAEHDGDTLADEYYYMHDRLGSVRQVINSNGIVVKMFTFSPFGEISEDYGEFYTPWKFTGQYLDSETGQYYLRARQYSPYLSRFTGRDLIMGEFENPLTLHKYLYCKNDPINNFDLNGKWTAQIHREFGNLGDPTNPGHSEFSFDYARLDKDYAATDLLHYDRNAPLHFMSREQVLPYLIGSIAYGDTTGIRFDENGIVRETGFEYAMHSWQDTYVHWDNKFRWESGGHGGESVKRWVKRVLGGDAPDVDEHTAANDAAYQRCDATTRAWEEIWLKFNEGEYKGSCNEFDRSTLVWQEWFYARDEKTGQLIFR